jgi:signal transduction histidine kinase
VLSSSRGVELKDRNLLVESDEKRIKQVLMNLQSNALKFTKEGGKIQIICELVQANNS